MKIKFANICTNICTVFSARSSEIQQIDKMLAAQKLPADFKSKYDSVLEELKMAQRENAGYESVQADFDVKGVLVDIREKIKNQIRKYKCLKFKQEHMINLPAIKELPKMQEFKFENEHEEERLFHTLESFRLRQKRKEEKSQPSFRFVKQLNFLIYDETDSKFLSSRLLSKVLEIVEDWVTGCTFNLLTVNIRYGYLMRFLKRRPSDETVNAADWPLDQSQRSYVMENLFDNLVALLDSIFSSNLQFLPAILDIGWLNFQDLVQYLQQTMVPFAGPFRLPQSDQKVLDVTTMFLKISSVNEADTKMNGGLPLNGIFNFYVNRLTKSEEELALIDEYPEISDSANNQKTFI